MQWPHVELTIGRFQDAYHTTFQIFPATRNSKGNFFWEAMILKVHIYFFSIFFTFCKKRTGIFFLFPFLLMSFIFQKCVSFDATFKNKQSLGISKNVHSVEIDFKNRQDKNQLGFKNQVTNDQLGQISFKNRQDKNNLTLRTKMAVTKNVLKVKFDCTW